VLGVFRPHLGVDYSAPTGTPIYAAGSGRVAVAGWKNGFGKFIQIQHGSDFSTMYGHLSSFAAGVRAGERFNKASSSAIGATGLATGLISIAASLAKAYSSIRLGLSFSHLPYL
jgi:murein DD-endopeptidase MepM/ murein hydrolase activator NlpD